jgi:hypothetical protein
MDIEAFRASLNAAEPPRDMRDALRALWFDAREIGTARTMPHRLTRAEPATGCTPICIARRATPATPPTGIVARRSPFADRRSTRNGRRSPTRF